MRSSTLSGDAGGGIKPTNSIIPVLPIARHRLEQLDVSTGHEIIGRLRALSEIAALMLPSASAALMVVFSNRRGAIRLDKSKRSRDVRNRAVMTPSITEKATGKVAF
jgi:hypothetical protein